MLGAERGRGRDDVCSCYCDDRKKRRVQYSPLRPFHASRATNATNVAFSACNGQSCGASKLRIGEPPRCFRVVLFRLPSPSFGAVLFILAVVDYFGMALHPQRLRHDKR